MVRASSKTSEDVFIETLIPQPAVQTLDEGILDGFARVNELQPDAVVVRPRVEHPARKLRAGSHLEDLRQAPGVGQPVEHPDHSGPRQREVRLNHRALSRKLVHDRERPKAAPVAQAVRHKVHGPPLVDLLGRRPGAAQMTAPLAAPSASQRQPFIAIEPLHPLVIDGPALPRGQWS